MIQEIRSGEISKEIKIKKRARCAMWQDKERDRTYNTLAKMLINVVTMGDNNEPDSSSVQLKFGQSSTC